MINIRKGTFETNSSSTHTIVIPRESRGIVIPDEIEINLSDYEFGWEYDKYYTPEEKLAYIIMGLTNQTYTEGLAKGCEKIEKLLNTIGQWVRKVEVHGVELLMYDGRSYLDEEDYGYVDHASDLFELLDVLLSDEDSLKRYLFSSDAFIATGNDNSDGYPKINVNYPYDEYFKGN